MCCPHNPAPVASVPTQIRTGAFCPRLPRTGATIDLVFRWPFRLFPFAAAFLRGAGAGVLDCSMTQSPCRRRSQRPQRRPLPAMPAQAQACLQAQESGRPRNPEGPRIRMVRESGRSENPDGVAFIQSMKTERRVMPAGPDIVHHRRAEAGRGGAFHAVLRLGLSLVRTIQARSGRASSAALTIADSKTGAPIRLPRLRPAGFPPEPNGRAGAARLQGSAGPGLRASRCRSDRGCARRTS